jgi:hypothetical protein
MNSIRKLFAVIALSLGFAVPAFATDCTGTITGVQLDYGASSPHFYAALSVGVGVDITIADTIKDKVAVGMLAQAYDLGRTVTIRFAASGVTCSTATYRTDLFSIILVP